MKFISLFTILALALISLSAQAKNELDFSACATSISSQSDIDVKVCYAAPRGIDREKVYLTINEAVYYLLDSGSELRTFATPAHSFSLINSARPRA